MVEMDFQQPIPPPAGSNMRDFSEFCEQLHEMRLKFHKWDSCERTVAIYYLMVGLPFANARFLHHALEQCLAAASTPEAQVMERNANDTTYIAGFLSESSSPQKSLSLILSHLPLLRPGNRDAASSYLKTIRKLLTDFISPPPPYKIYNDCVEIMSYVFIHPAFDKEEKKSFKHLLKQVLSRMGPDNFIPSPVDFADEPTISPNRENSHKNRLNRRSNSLTPAPVAGSSSHESLLHPQMQQSLNWSSQENLSPPLTKPRSYSLSHDKTVTIHSAVQSSSSETRLQELQSLNNLPVMKSIVAWLKSLRLHKYSWVFNNLTYSQMLNLTEETLQAMGITKGARHKLLLSISKLKERAELLQELEQEVVSGGDINGSLKKLKTILQSPLQVSLGEDLPAMFTKVMGKVWSQLLLFRSSPEENILLFNSICERAETMDAFSHDQIKKLMLWRAELSKRDHIPTFIYQRHQNSNNMRNANLHFRTPSTPIEALRSSSYTQKSSSYPNMQPTAPLKLHRHSVGSVQMQNHFLANPGSNIFKIDVPEMKSPSNLQHLHVRFKDNDLQSSPAEKENNNLKNNLEIENSLESLCLQMMEHALGP